MTPAPVREGDVLAGKYRIDRVLGAGGMGVVVAATHVTLGERVALKFLLNEAAESGDAVARFLREARAAARIKSEHIARVFDVGTLENGAPYYVMEYLEGSDLGAVLTKLGALSVRDAVDYVLQACEAVAQAHALGIVHRDLKPANLFVVKGADGADLIKVLDFGISKLAGTASGDALTRTSVAMGSPLYMSPEQMTSARDVDARSDIWALGVVLYELVSGTPPFPGATLPQVCAAVLNGATPSLRERRPDLPLELDRVIANCLGKRPEQRFGDVAALAAALSPLAAAHSLPLVERVARILGKRERPPGPSVPEVDAQAATAVAQSAGSSSTQQPWSHTRPRQPGETRRSNARLAWFAAAAAGSFVAVGALGWMVGHRTPQPVSGVPTSAEHATLERAPIPAAPAATRAGAFATNVVVPAPAPAAIDDAGAAPKSRSTRPDPRRETSRPPRPRAPEADPGGREYDPREHL